MNTLFAVVRAALLWIAVTWLFSPALLAQANNAVPSEDLTARVAALSDKAPAEARKKAVLEVALERINHLRNKGQAADAAAQTADVLAALRVPAENLAARVSSPEHISALFPLRAVEGNPYIQWIKEGLGAELAKPDDFLAPDAYEKNSIGTSPTSLNGGLANTIDGLLWAYVHPASPFVDNPEVLRRYLRRAHFYIDGIQAMADLVISNRKGYLDEFALGPVSTPLREFAQLYPGLLLPSQKQLWDQAMRRAADAQLQDIGRFVGDYANIDTARGLQLLNFGLYLKDAGLLEKARSLAVVQKKNVLPDGGVSYIKTQNAQQGYQYTVAKYLARYYEITRDSEVLDILNSMEWYGPVSGRSGEWWTASNWKAMWNNSGQDIGGNFVAAVTGNPYLYGMRGEPSIEPVRKWRDARFEIAWYRNDVKPKPLPDNYTVIDRNIAGPRAWYGDFTYAATLRNLDPSETGHGTLMGCMVVDAQNRQGSIIPRFAPKVLISYRGNPAWAWITSELQSTLSIGRHFSVVTGTYSPSTFGSSSKGGVAEWICRQVWLGLPDRIIGLLEISPSVDEAQAYEVSSYAQLGVGGPENAVTRLKADSYAFGDLEIRAHESNYRTMDLGLFNTRHANQFGTELNWRSEPSGWNSDKATLVQRNPKEDGRAPLIGIAPRTLKTYTRDQKFYNVVEVRTKAAQDISIVKRITSPAGLIGLDVRIGKKAYVVWINSTEQSQTVTLPSTPETSLHKAGAPPVTPIVPAPATVEIAARQHVVFVSSSSPEDHLPGWASFQSMLATKP